MLFDGVVLTMSQKNLEKGGEGALCVAFHQSKAIVATGGADGSVLVFS